MTDPEGSPGDAGFGAPGAGARGADGACDQHGGHGAPAGHGAYGGPGGRPGRPHGPGPGAIGGASPPGADYPYTEPYDYTGPDARAEPWGRSQPFGAPGPAPPPPPAGQGLPGEPAPGPRNAGAADAEGLADATLREEPAHAAEPADPASEAPPLRRPGQGRADRRRAAKRIQRRRRLSATKEFPLLVCVALLIAWVLKTFLVQAFVIPSGSMEQTIRIGDRVLVDKFTPWFGAEPHRGDVVVFQDPGGWLENEKKKPDGAPVGIKQGKELLTFIGLLPSDDEQDLIKRVVAVGGDTVRCCDKQGRVTVNGTPLNEPYLHPGNKPSRMKFTVNVPAGRVFVMGDHRANSADSRYHLKDSNRGTIGEDRIVGKAVVIAWPFDHWRRLEEPGVYASVPDPGGGAVSLQMNRDNRVAQLPFSAELPLVMGMVGLYRWRDRRMRGVRSGCGGFGGRYAVRIRVPGGRRSGCGRQDGRRRSTGRGKRE
ncbi:signal peptidase I [Streptomyces sp. WMMB303]|uniref:signal peptidase I n=1 Tax=Streptomyces sp. WMMB303 TaxID=3034154 RepID=UPI003207DBD3